jgi:hypothetical protein
MLCGLGQVPNLPPLLARLDFHPRHVPDRVAYRPAACHSPQQWPSRDPPVRPPNTHLRGGAIQVNFFDPEGRLFDCNHVEKLANEERISLKLSSIVPRLAD